MVIAAVEGACAAASSPFLETGRAPSCRGAALMRGASPERNFPDIPRPKEIDRSCTSLLVSVLMPYAKRGERVPDPAQNSSSSSQTSFHSGRTLVLVVISKNTHTMIARIRFQKNTPSRDNEEVTRQRTIEMTKRRMPFLER